MRVEWSAIAESDLVSLVGYIADDDPAAAMAVFNEINSQVARLADHAYLGRTGRVHGTRELVINRTPFVVIYRVEERAAAILRVLHGKQQWPPTKD